jgi:hypothetical protein
VIRRFASRLDKRAREERGFTLVELLVVERLTGESSESWSHALRQLLKSVPGFRRPCHCGAVPQGKTLEDFVEVDGWHVTYFLAYYALEAHHLGPLS